MSSFIFKGFAEASEQPGEYFSIFLLKILVALN